jgi:hypothetical protein
MLKRGSIAGFVVLFLAAQALPALAATVNVTVQNRSAAQVRITLTGPYYYSFTLKTGKNPISMEPGTYTYSYFACEKTKTGKLTVKANGAKLDIPKCQAAKAKNNKDKCDPSYPTVCIPPRPPDLDCNDIRFRNFPVKKKDPHNFDGDNDGIGCET